MEPSCFIYKLSQKSQAEANRTLKKICIQMSPMITRKEEKEKVNVISFGK